MKPLYERNNDKLHELMPDAHWAAEMWHAECWSLNRPFTVAEVFRTVERQQSLYAKGRTEPGPIVTERDGVTILSEHQTRLAADIYPNCEIKYRNTWWKDIADVGKKYGIFQPYTTGRFIDLPHFTFGSAKKKPEPKPFRPPASPKEEVRILRRRLLRTKPGKAYDRLVARILEIQSAK